MPSPTPLRTLSRRVLSIACLLVVISAGLLIAPAAVTVAQDDDFTYTVVGGVDEPQTYPDQTVEGVTFSDLHYRSLFPFGMEFKAIITPPAGQAIDQVTLGDPAAPAFEVGEQVTLPAAPFSQPIYNAPTVQSIADGACFANTPVTILDAGNDGEMNWYEVDCMGMTGWMNQGQLVTQ
jgi:hypothetical protein